ncbi:MAG: type II toxin-antitoxin system YoeB family toxin [Treponema sp.]|nr:type II toxin-antitoxin system YoeB family toxin [Treponema sp.]
MTLPFQNPPPYEKLQSYEDTTYSRRINIQHRLVYQVLPKATLIKSNRGFNQCFLPVFA